jgi:hypothetical protein
VLIFDRKTIPWFLLFAALLVASILLYIPYRMASAKGPHGGSWIGLAYGTAGTLMILIAMFLRARKSKRLRTARIGRAYQWMQAHAWLGLLSYPVILFHAGFHWGGPLTQVLMWTFTVVIVSGVVGLLLQQFIPTKMMRDVPRETIYEQLRHVLTQLRREASDLVAAAVARQEQEAFVLEAVPAGAPRETLPPESTEGERLLHAFYTDDVAPFLEDRYPRRNRLAAPDSTATAFRLLRSQLPPGLHETLDDLRAIVDERRELERQRRLHLWLHGWLFIHVPLSYAMLIFTAWHIFGALRFASLGE